MPTEWKYMGYMGLQKRKLTHITQVLQNPVVDPKAPGVRDHYLTPICLRVHPEWRMLAADTEFFLVPTTLLQTLQRWADVCPYCADQARARKGVQP